MRKKGFKGRCEKRVIAKCAEVCRTYDEVQSAYAGVLSANERMEQFEKVVLNCILYYNG